MSTQPFKTSSDGLALATSTESAFIAAVQNNGKRFVKRMVLVIELRSQDTLSPFDKTGSQKLQGSSAEKLFNLIFAATKTPSSAHV